MPLKPWVWISGLLLLSGCATESQDQGVQAEYLALMRATNEKAATGGATQGVGSVAQNSQEVKPEQPDISDENLAAMARHMVMDIPNSPNLEAQAGVTTVLVQAQHFRLEEGLELNTSLLAQRLLLALQYEHSRVLNFVSVLQGESKSSKGGSGKGGSSSGRSKSSAEHGQRSSAYRLEGIFSNLKPSAEQESARRYEFQLVNVQTGRAIWMGSFDINVPKAQPTESGKP